MQKEPAAHEDFQQKQVQMTRRNGQADLGGLVSSASQDSRKAQNNACGLPHDQHVYKGQPQGASGRALCGANIDQEMEVTRGDCVCRQLTSYCMSHMTAKCTKHPSLHQTHCCCTTDITSMPWVPQTTQSHVQLVVFAIAADNLHACSLCTLYIVNGLGFTAGKAYFVNDYKSV